MVETFRKFFPNIQKEELHKKIMSQFSTELDREHREVTKQFIKNVQIEVLWNQRRIAIKTLGGGDCFYYALAQQLIETDNFKFKQLPDTIFRKAFAATEARTFRNAKEKKNFLDMMKVRYDLYDWVLNKWKMYYNGGQRTLKEFYSYGSQYEYVSKTRIADLEDARYGARTVGEGVVPGFVVAMLSDIEKQGIDAEFIFLQFVADKYGCDIEFAVCTNATVEPGDSGWKEPALGHGTIKSYEPLGVPKLGIALYNVGRHRHFVATVSIDGTWSLQKPSKAVKDAYSFMGYNAGTGTATEKFRNLLTFLKDSKQNVFFQKFAEKFLEEQKKPENLNNTTPKLAASFIDRTLITCNKL